jgi:AcrR family transcriptional regulator
MAQTLRHERISLPQQARSRGTMQRVLKTLLAMLETRPFNEITIADLARRADAAVTSIYARFEDKRALLLAAHQLHSEEVIEQIDRAFGPSHLQSASVPEVVETALVQAMKTFSRRKNLHRAVLAAADPDVALRAAEMIRHFSQRVTQLIRGKLRGLDDQELERRTDFALRAAMAVMQQRIIFGDVEPSRFALSERELQSRLLAMILAVLRAPLDH